MSDGSSRKKVEFKAGLQRNKGAYIENFVYQKNGNNGGWQIVEREIKRNIANYGKDSFWLSVDEEYFRVVIKTKKNGDSYSYGFRLKLNKAGKIDIINSLDDRRLADLGLIQISQ